MSSFEGLLFAIHIHRALPNDFLSLVERSRVTVDGNTNQVYCMMMDSSRLNMNPLY